MADSLKICPFIKKWEGDYGNDPDDLGGETRKGITYTTWKSVFGDTHDRFMKMSDEDWAKVFHDLFWSKIQGDKINSQKIADILVDWVWTSGASVPCKRLQALLNTMGNNLVVDGKIGDVSIAAINNADQNKLYTAIIKDRFDYLDEICKARPKNLKFLKGWQNRITNLTKSYL